MVDELYNYLFELGKSPADSDVHVDVATALGCLALVRPSFQFPNNPA